MIKEKIIKLIGIALIITIPMIIFTHQYGSQPYFLPYTPLKEKHISEYQCNFKKISKRARYELKNRNIAKLLSIKRPYNSWPKARRQLLREKLAYLQNMVNQIASNDPREAIENLEIRLRALKNMD